MPLICEVIPGVRSAALTWLLPCGSAADPDNRQGMSTLLSEMIFRGAGARDSRAQADALDTLGLGRGCDVGPMFLRLSATMIGATARAALPLLVDMVRVPTLGADALEPARDLALQSLAGLADNPQERAGVLLAERHNHPPLNRSGMGDEPGLSAIERDELVAHWHARVRPESSILAIAGDIDPAAIARELDVLLAGWSGRAAPVAVGTSATRGTYHHVEDPSSQVQVFLAHEAPPEPSTDSKLERLVAAVLSGGPSARLFSEVREKRGLCYAVSASYAPDKFAGRIVAYVGTTPERAQQSLDVLAAELRRIQGPAEADLVQADEFDRAMVGARTRLVFSGESTGSRAAALALDHYRLGRARSLAEIADELARIRLADVHAYLRRRTIGAVTVVTLGPRALTWHGAHGGGAAT